MPTRKIVSLPSIRLSYLEWNTGATPLLLLHGLGDNAAVWSSLGDTLAPNYRVVAPDLRGHGDSSKPDRGYTFADIIADLQALMEHLGWSDAHLLGHSWTGKLLPFWATQHPQQFRSLILVDPFYIDKIPSGFRVTFPLLYKILPFLREMGPFESYDSAIAQAKKLKQYRGWTSLQQQAFQAGIEEKPDGTWERKFSRQARNEVFAEVMRVASLTQPLEIPTLFVQPQQGLNRREWQLRPYKTHLKNLQICKVPGNHWAFLVEPIAFNAAIAAFLNHKSAI